MANLSMPGMCQVFMEHVCVECASHAKKTTLGLAASPQQASTLLVSKVIGKPSALSKGCLQEGREAVDKKISSEKQQTQVTSSPEKAWCFVRCVYGLRARAEPCVSLVLAEHMIKRFRQRSVSWHQTAEFRMNKIVSLCARMQ
jgi:hypothetical protein